MQTLVNRHITRLDALTPADEPRSGAKAFNCARLKQAGFPVPDGLVVLATAADEDFQSIVGDPWFDGLSPDEVFAVRSSGIGETSRDNRSQAFTKPCTGSRCSTRSMASAGPREIPFRTHRRSLRRRSIARWGVTAVSRSPDSIQFSTSWTTRRIPACSSSPRGRSTACTPHGRRFGQGTTKSLVAGRGSRGLLPEPERRAPAPRLRRHRNRRTRGSARVAVVQEVPELIGSWTRRHRNGPRSCRDAGADVDPLDRQ